MAEASGQQEAIPSVKTDSLTDQERVMRDEETPDQKKGARDKDVMISRAPSGSSGESESEAQPSTEDGGPSSELHKRIGQRESVSGLAVSESRISVDICRICHGPEEDCLMSPCNCKGSLSLVHRACLERWLAQADSSVCELCGHVYTTKRTPRYSLLSSIWAWFRSADTLRERRDLAFDFLAFCAFTPMAGTATYMAFLMTQALYGQGPIELTSTNLPGRLATLSMISMMTTLDMAYATWIAIRFKHHVGNWYSWYRRNSKVTILPPNQSPERSDPTPSINQ